MVKLASLRLAVTQELKKPMTKQRKKSFLIKFQ